ncbi:TerB family tellurite resistance protein [Ekhidna sp.]|uniref:tellurite resistance TerB family protein n=1 Tax=Ekhidna sp. TaxID=2608089 RepID=UPI003CCBE20A
MNKTEKFRALIRMALIDNRFEDEEKILLQELAQDHQLEQSDLDQLIQEELERKEIDKPMAFNLDFDGKIEILADLVKIMKADGKVYLSEIKFCEKMAIMLGFDQNSIGFLSEMVHKDKSVPPNWDIIQSKMKEFVA